MNSRCRVLFLKTKGFRSWLYRMKYRSPWDDVALEYDNQVYWIGETGTAVVMDLNTYLKIHRLEFQPATQRVHNPTALLGYLNLCRTKQGQRPLGRFDWTHKNILMVYDALQAANVEDYGEGLPYSVVDLWHRLPNLAYITQT